MEGPKAVGLGGQEAEGGAGGERLNAWPGVSGGDTVLCWWPVWENLSFLLSWADSFALTHTLKTGASDARANKDEPWDERSVCRSVQLSGPGS